jgi:phosphatidylserine/phosphatidylglycerophosphate/cardiolipin synthase-like enzyme
MTGASGDLAAVIADLAERMPPGHLAAWARVLRTVPAQDLVMDGRLLEARLIEARPGVALGGAAARLIAAWQAADPALPGAALAVALEAAAIVTKQAAAQRTDIVVSGPASDSAAVRLTGSVISELIHDCRDSLLIVSFAAFGVTEVVHELVRAAKRGVRIDLVLETTAAEGGALHGPVGAAAAFQTIRQDATFWTWPAAQRPTVSGSRAALHAKLVAADERVALLGSANLTDKALALNLELGVIIRDPEVVRRMVRHFRSLMDPGEGIIQPLPRQIIDPAM